MSIRLLTAGVTALLLGGIVIAADAEKISTQCLVATTRKANPAKFSEYKSAKVFFCCDNCKGKFDADPAKFEVAANHQLAETAQYEQQKCPLSGGPIDPTKSIEIDGVKVSFCCEKCQGKAM